MLFSLSVEYIENLETGGKYLLKNIDLRLTSRSVVSLGTPST